MGEEDSGYVISTETIIDNGFEDMPHFEVR